MHHMERSGPSGLSPGKAREHSTSARSGAHKRYWGPVQWVSHHKHSGALPTRVDASTAQVQLIKAAAKIVRIGNAIKAYDERDKVKVAALAREFDVPYNMLRRRILGMGPNRGGAARLDPAQEKELDDWMISLESGNTPATPGMVEGEANRILARAGVETQVGRNWPYRFIARRPSRRPDLPRPLSALNSSARNKDQIKSKIRKAIELLEEVADDLDKLNPKLRDRVTGVLAAG
ncbi:hypothetical protein N7519_002836 [Penicillium mononematosum]|uniref:uncharacterized protein n=1 Tax=Penicillium mononematosum TaxID=268346 RepID=UPI00254875B0|nr:uncharacterized protein N7519_002836 [Penicillium mononematosum]KAJ6187928.1 hypothetical protein N7519_002836 [Penicillium mononematosum]